MRVGAVVGAIVLALAVQTTLGEVLTGDRGGLDLVLVVVVYFSLTWGPVAGLLAGAFGGLLQDCLAVTGFMTVAPTGAISITAGVIGVGGLAKTIVGFGTGLLGTQVIVAGIGPRAATFFGASIVHAIIFLGALALLGLRTAAMPYDTIVIQAVGNAVVGAVGFQLVQAFPGWLERRRLRRHRFARRL